MENDNPKIYSKNAIDITTFFGGPLAGVYMMYKNYMSFGRREDAKKILSKGLLVIAIFYGAYSFAPIEFVKKFQFAVAIIAFAIVHWYMTKTQAKQIDEHIKNGWKINSAWKGFWVFLLSAFLQVLYVAIFKFIF